MRGEQQGSVCTDLFVLEFRIHNLIAVVTLRVPVDLVHSDAVALLLVMLLVLLPSGVRGRGPEVARLGAQLIGRDLRDRDAPVVAGVTAAVVGRQRHLEENSGQGETTKASRAKPWRRRHVA